MCVSPPNEDDLLKGTAVRRAVDNEAGSVIRHVSPRLKRERNSLCVVCKQPQCQHILLDGKRGERQQTVLLRRRSDSNTLQTDPLFLLEQVFL